MASETWNQVAVPILEYVVEHRGGRPPIKVADVGGAIGASDDEVVTEVERLIESGFLVGELVKYLGPSGHWMLYPIDLSERGLCAVGVWPSDDPIDALNEVVGRLIDQAHEPVERSNLEKFRAAALSLGRETFVAVVASLAGKGVTGLP